MIFTIIFMAIQLSQADQEDSCRLPLAKYIASIQEIEKVNEIQKLEKDPRLFCDNNMLRRHLNASSKKFDSNIVSDSDLLEIVEKQYEEEEKGGLDRGFLALPFKKKAELMGKSHILLPNDFGFVGSDSQLEKLSLMQTLEETEKTINENPCKLPDHSGTDLDEIKRNRGVLPLEESTITSMGKTAGTLYTCGELVSLTHINSCKNSMQKIINRVAQRGGARTPPLTSMPELLDKVINSGQFDKGLKIAAKKIIHKVKNPEKIESDIFTDLKSSFKEAGYSDSISEQLSFETLGLISTAGPALNIRLNKIAFKKDRWPTVTALTAIASLLPALDFHSAKKGKPYSFPPGVKANCNTSKSYHFWQTAYQSRKELMEGASPESASAAAFNVSKLYHVTGNLTNRAGASTLFLHPSISPVSNIVRADLSYASAGALYGAGLQHDEPIDIDKGISELINSTPMLPKLSSKESESAVSPVKGFGYFRFKEQFKPDVVYRAHSEGKEFKKPNLPTDNELQELQRIQIEGCK